MRLKLGVLLVALGAGLPARPEASPLHVDGLRADLSSAAEFALGDAPGGVAGLDRLDWRPIRVPASWQRAGIPDHGYAWYRFRFTLSPEAAAHPMAFTCSEIRDVDETFLDGVRVGGTGAFPPRYDKGTLQARLYELPASLTSAAGPHVLAVRVFNAGPRPGGVMAAPYLDTVSGAFWERTMFESPLALVAAAIFSLGVFALIVFLRDRRQREFLFFFLLTAGVAAYVISWLSLWSRFGVSLSFIFRANFALAFALSALFTLFFHYFFVLEIPRWMRVVLAVQLAGLLAACALPRVDDLYAILPVCYATVIASGFRIVQALVRKLRRRAPHALTILVGFGLIFLATLRDMAQDLGLISWSARTRYVGLAFLGLAVLDLDRFKEFNDRFGHLAGDRLLIAAGERLSESVRTTDLAVRFGGEEFVLLLPEISAEEAMRCCERIREAVRGIRVFGAEAGTTISIGVAVHEPKGGPPPSEAALLRVADAALYRAKALGRDRVFMADGPVPSEIQRPTDGESVSRAAT